MEASSSSQPRLQLEDAGPSIQRFGSTDSTWSQPSLDDDETFKGELTHSQSLCIPPMSFGYSPPFSNLHKQAQSDTDV